MMPNHFLKILALIIPAAFLALPAPVLGESLWDSILSLPASLWGEAVDYDDLVERDGLYYKKQTDVPFTGEVTGLRHGKIRSGKIEGKWVGYHDNGQLEREGTYRDGKEEGEWVFYYDNGQLYRKGTFRNGKKEGEWVWYGGNGQLWKKETYENGIKVSD